MQIRRGDDPRGHPTEPALRAFMRRLREIMAEPSDGQARLDMIVRQVAGLMVAEVCSIYIKRQDASLELFATEGLNKEAVHKTKLKRGEGLVGRCAEIAAPVETRLKAVAGHEFRALGVAWQVARNRWNDRRD